MKLPGEAVPVDGEIREQIVAAFGGANALASEEKQLVLNLCETRLVNRNAILCREGEICRSLFLIHKGIVRGYFHAGGKDVTTWFAFEGQCQASVPSLLKGLPATDSLETLEDSILTVLDYSRLERYFNRHPAILRLCYSLLSEYFLLVDDRTTALQCKSAGERLQALVRHEPQVLERIPAYHIATYLGITPETLSRTRAKLFPTPPAGDDSGN